MTRDRLTLLNNLRPPAELDAVWTLEQQVAVRDRIVMDRTPATTAPSRRRRVAGIAAVLALGLIASPGVAGAVGNGMRPQAFIDAYDYWGNIPKGAVDPATARRAATAPGPFGGIFSVLTAKNSEGLTCIGPVFESSASAKAVLPDNFNDGGSFCQEAPSTKPFGFASLMYTRTAAVWWADAGGAVTGELRMPSGETYPVVLVQGYLFGWYPLPLRTPDESPTLIGYAADGSVVGQDRV